MTLCLSSFTGSETFYKHFLKNVSYSEGVRYLAENAKCYWLIDAIASHLVANPKLTKEMRENDRLACLSFWHLVPNGEGAILSCREDRDMTPVITQEIPFTDFPFNEVSNFRLYVSQHGNGYIIYLPSEY